MTVSAEEKTVLDFLPQLEEALAYTDTHTPQDVAREIMAGRAQLWVEGDGMIVTEIEDTPKARILRFWLAAGNMDDVLQITERCYEWGRKQGCTRATVLGRKGWARVLADQGWEPNDKLICMTREL